MQKNITQILPMQYVFYEGFPQVAKDIETLRIKYFKEYIYPDNTRRVMINNADWFGAIYDLFNAGVVWGKRMERARRKAARTNNNGRGCKNPWSDFGEPTAGTITEKNT